MIPESGVNFTPSGPFTSACLLLLPLLPPTYIAITRVMDYYHNVSDVMAGGLIGLVSAVVSYLSYYHSPVSKRAGQSRDMGVDRRLQDGGGDDDVM